MMSKFKYCPMCGTERLDDSRFCQKCNFEFLTGKYVKVEEEPAEITVEKVSQEEFIDSNQLIQDTNLKINALIAKYLNNALTDQFNEDYDKIVPISINEYISSFSNSDVYADFNGDFLDSLNNLLNDDEYKNSIDTFIQWIGENRSHLPGMVINQYMIPHQATIMNMENILGLDLDDNEDNGRFIGLLNDYLNIEKEFIEKLV